MGRPFLLQRSPQSEFLEQSPGAITVRGVSPGPEFIISEDVAGCLKALDSPTDIQVLHSHWGLTRETVAKLLDAQLLVEATDEPSDPRLLSDFFPRFLNCPRGPAGGAQITVFGAPSDLLSQTGSGPRGGPAAFRMASSQLDYVVGDDGESPQGWYDCASGLHVLRGVTFVDAGDVTTQLGESGLDYGVRLAQTARRCVALGSIPVALGGDHSISYWLISAVQRAIREPIAVLHLDAHSDLSGRIEQGVPTNGSFARWLIEENSEMPFISVGLKGFQAGRQPSLAPRHMLISAEDTVRRRAEWVLSHLPETMPCYVSLDMDVLDPSVAPATNVPIPGGLSFETVREILTLVGVHRRIAGVDVVELNPDRDLYLRTASSGLHLLMALLGAAVSTTKSREGENPQ